jgi:hypothetical protein
MSTTPTEELVQLVRQHYPQAHSREDALDRGGLYDRTPEHQRWKEAWSKARKDQPWSALAHKLKEQIPGHPIDTYVPQYLAGGYSCFFSVQTPLPEGGHRLMRVGGAISVLAPLYLLFGTTEVVTPKLQEETKRASGGGWTFFQRIQPQLALPPTTEMQPYAEAMARCIEGTLGYHPFPVELARVAVPGIHVAHVLYGEANLMNTLFMSDAALFLTDP